MRVFIRQLLKQQSELNNLDRRISLLGKRIDAMVNREAQALGELVTNAPRSNESNQQVISFDDDFFLLDDLNPKSLAAGLAAVEAGFLFLG